MTEYVRYLTHPQVEIDPAVPVGDWGLNDVGHSRVSLLIASRALVHTKSVISSAECKACETGRPLADALSAQFEIHPDMHENDRSATGYLARDAFEEAADAFFANPQLSMQGWERAVDAQSRICRAVEAALQHAPKGDVLLVGHGAVGTLLWCALTGHPISRAHDQPDGGGNAFGFVRDSREMLHGWTPIEQLAPLR
jgi:broad specificity phosphatase PhoE